MTHNALRSLLHGVHSLFCLCCFFCQLSLINAINTNQMVKWPSGYLHWAGTAKIQNRITKRKFVSDLLHERARLIYSVALFFNFYVFWSVRQFIHVPGRCFKPRKLTSRLLCKLGAYREAYGCEDSSALNFSVHGRTMNSGTLEGALLRRYKKWRLLILVPSTLITFTR